MCQKLTSVCILLGFVFSDHYSRGTLQMQKLREEGLSFKVTKLVTELRFLPHNLDPERMTLTITQQWPPSPL